ncbi:MAG: T9SS type A sorting domain-containing protein [Ignavibacteria bacterium]|nr:MAG: T9SS type A sorting domain-containing protein [Ignavibacteria bacterium]
MTEQLPAAPGWSQTYPPGNAWTVSVDTGGLTFVDKDFGNYGAPVSISGTVFTDLNNNGVRDSNDYGLAGWSVYTSGLTYLYTVTDSNGNYSFTALPPGAYDVNETPNPEYAQTYPPATYYSLTLNPGDSASGKDFGNHKLPTSFESFSKLAFETGGFFAFIPATVLGDTSEARRFINTAYNVLQGGITKSVGVIEPPKIPLGTTVTVDISGSKTNFQPGTSLYFSGAGVTASNVRVISPIRLEADVTVDPGATLGFRDIVTVTDLGGGQHDTASGKGSLELIATPAGATILGIAPNTGARGDSMVVIISAVNTNFADTSSVYLGRGVTVTGRTALSPTKLRAFIKINQKTDIGFRDVSVTTGSQNATESVPGPFFISSSAPQYAFLASVGPGSAYQGDSLTINVAGTNTTFAAGVSVVSFSGSGIEVLATRVTTTTTADVDIRIDRFAPAGYRDVFVTTGPEEAAILSAFNVLVNPLGVAETGRIPTHYSLLQSYPNPFNPSTVIQFDLPKSSRTTLKIYDVLGREIATLLNDEPYAPGTYRIVYQGGSLASGVYFYSLKAVASGSEVFEEMRKMIFMK